MTKNPRPTNIYDIISTLLLPLTLRKSQLCSYNQVRVDHALERVTPSMSQEG